jgi:hypothetical protein
MHLYYNDDTHAATLVVVFPLGSGRPPVRIAGAAAVDYLHTRAGAEDTVQLDVLFTDATHLTDQIPDLGEVAA